MQTLDLSPELHASRRRILEVSCNLFAEHGYAAVSMRQVAQASGLSKSSLFHHFPTKLALYGAVLRVTLEHLDGALSEELEGDAGEDPLARFFAWLDRFVDALVAHPAYAPLLLRSLFEEEPLDREDGEATAAMTITLVSRVRRLLKQTMENGRFRKVPTDQVIQSMIGMVVYHFASGRFGQSLFGASVFEPEQVEARKAHLRLMLTAMLQIDG